MKQVYILALLLLFAVSCTTDEKQRLAELQRSLDEIEGQAAGIDLPDAVEPGHKGDADYVIAFDKARYGVDAGGSVTVGYTLPEASTVSIAVQGGWKASVSQSGSTQGTIVITAPDPASPSEMVVTATTQGGKTVATAVPVMVRDPYTDATRTRAELLGYYNFKPRWATAENFQKLADAGLTSVTVECDDYDYKDQIELAWQAGLKSLPIVGGYAEQYLAHPDTYTGLDDIINYLKEQPGVMAYHMCDEPSKVEIPSLKIRKEKIESLDPEHPVYINLNPDGSTGALGTDNYRDYIEAFARDCGCKFISFDMYPILPGGEVMAGWHKCLRAVADISRQYNIPFWAFAASCHIDNEGGVIKRGRPSVENLRLQTYTDLAYGAQVVQFFTIQQYGGTTFSPIMQDGTWTEAYDFLKTACLQVQKRGYVFNGCSVGKLRFTQTPAAWGESLSEVDLPAEIGSIETSHTALVSFLENRGNRYIAIVNQSYTDRITAQVAFCDMVYTIEQDGSFVEHNPGIEEFTIDEGDLMVIKVK